MENSQFNGDQLQNNRTITPKHGLGKIWIIIISVIIAGGLAGGGTYYFMNKKATTDKNNLQSQINDLNVKLSAATKTASTAPTTGPATIVTNFYNWWNNGSGLDNTLASAPGGSQAFQNWYDTAINSEGGGVGGIDPISCAQDVPPSFSAEISSKSSTSAQVSVTENFTPSIVLTVNLKANNGSWQLESVTCPS